MFETFGDRLTYCRGLLGYSRNEMSLKLGDISSQCLTRWELNYVVIPKTRLLRLEVFFKKNNIQVSVEWLLSGKGLPPINLNQKEYIDSKFDDIIYVSALEIMQKIKNFQFKQVNNKFFEPILSYGDYVGGIINSDISLLDTKLCFIVRPNEVSTGYFSYKHKSLMNLKQETKTFSFDDILIGEIMWLARRT